MGHGVSCARTGDEHDYFRAAQLGDLDALDALLAADPSLVRRATLYDRLSSLHIAAANGRLEVLSMILDRGVPPDAVNRQKQACSVEVRDCGHQMCASCALALCCHSKPSPTTLALPSPACPFCRGSISRLPVASGPRASSRGGGPSGGRATSAARASRGCRRPWGPSRSRSSGPAGPWTATVATSTSLSMIRDSGIRFINAGGVRPRGW